MRHLIKKYCLNYSCNLRLFRIPDSSDYPLFGPFTLIDFHSFAVYLAVVASASLKAACNISAGQGQINASPPESRVI